MSLPYSRALETEADAVGVMLAAKVGYHHLKSKYSYSVSLNVALKIQHISCNKRNIPILVF